MAHTPHPYFNLVMCGTCNDYHWEGEARLEHSKRTRLYLLYDRPHTRKTEAYTEQT